MCGLCGSLGGSDWTDGVATNTASAIPHERRRARRERADAANRVLRVAGLSLADWQGSSFVVRSRTGGAATVAGLLDLWPAAERLSGSTLDPLDPALIARLG